MGDSSFQKLREILLEVTAVPAEKRAEALDRACAGDAELRAAAVRLLEFDAPESSLDESMGRPQGIGELSPSMIEDLADAVVSTAELAPGDRVGRFRVVREIGRGGMAVVFLAERDDGQFEQQVALKLLHLGPLREVVSRFEQERQILASLSHENIAGLIDGGVTEDGQPYIAMEYVEGTRIDAFCDGNELTVANRIRLFLVVARAVQHAHRNLVIHRDLKPSNILVRASGTVKLLDFGIAKLVDPEPYPHAAPPTRTSVRPMTPQYASPEQVRGEPTTTASDIYQLGLLLHELLTGQNPQRDVSAAELELAPPDTDPPRSSSATITSVEARARRTTAAGLRKLLRGDLDNIIAKALQRQPDRRYVSVDGLIDDLERHLEGRPVSARPDTFGYRAGRFVRRHRVGVSFAAAVLLLLVGYVVTLTAQAGRIARERDRARTEATRADQIKVFLVDLFQGADPYQAKGEKITAQELVDRGAERIETDLGEQPELRAEISGVIGEIYRRLGMFEEAAPVLEQSVRLSEERYGTEALETADAWMLLAALDQDRGNFAQAEELSRGALAIRQRLLGPGDSTTTKSMYSLARAHASQGRLADAEEEYRRALAFARERGPSAEAEIAQTLTALAGVLNHQGELEESEAVAREAVTIRQKLNERDTIGYSASLNNLAYPLERRGALEEAESTLRESADVARHLLGDEHPSLAYPMFNLARVLTNQGRLAEAESLYTAVLAIREATLPENHPMIAGSYNDLARLYQDSGRPERAEPFYRKAVEILRASDYPQISIVLYNLASLLHAEGDLEEAARLYDESVERDRAFVGSDHARIGRTLVALGNLERERDRDERAEAAFREAIRIFSLKLPEDHAQLADARIRLGGLLTSTGRADEAEPLLRAAVDSRAEAEEEPDELALRARIGLGDCLTHLGRFDEAEAELVSCYDDSQGSDSESTRQVLQALVTLCDTMGRTREAERYRSLMAE